MKKPGFTIITPNIENLKVVKRDGDMYMLRIEHPGEAMMTIELNKEEIQRFVFKLVELIKE